MALAIASCGTPPPPDPQSQDGSAETASAEAVDGEVRLKQHENQAAIDFLYPSDWTVIIPQQNFMAVGPTDTIVGDEPGPLMAILRVPIISVHGNLEGEFNHYLDFGPKRDGYATLREIEDFELDGQPAKQIRMNFEADPENNEISQEAWIVGAESNGGAVYIFSATAPPEDWEDNELFFKLIVESVEFNE
ncbi:MAG: hypothetical protein AAF485_23325 [Chloroflexota bacterium]